MIVVVVVVVVVVVGVGVVINSLRLGAPIRYLLSIAYTVVMVSFRKEKLYQLQKPF
jgi:Na+/H+ antiporter NhaC